MWFTKFEHLESWEPLLLKAQYQLSEGSNWIYIQFSKVGCDKQFWREKKPYNFCKHWHTNSLNTTSFAQNDISAHFSSVQVYNIYKTHPGPTIKIILLNKCKRGRHPADHGPEEEKNKQK